MRRPLDQSPPFQAIEDAGEGRPLVTETGMQFVNRGLPDLGQRAKDMRLRLGDSKLGERPFHQQTDGVGRALEQWNDAVVVSRSHHEYYGIAT